jgi:hypothetical protein
METVFVQSLRLPCISGIDLSLDGAEFQYRRSDRACDIPGI